MPQGSFTITPAGRSRWLRRPRSGSASGRAASWDGVMRLAFCLDGYAGPGGGGSPAGPGGRRTCRAVRARVHGRSADLGRVRDQVARVLSLDHDGREFSRVGERDPVIGRLQAAAPGLRPPLFYSPYEAAAWCVLSARRPARQMMQVRDRLNRAHGQVFDLAGEQVAALPAPAQLLAVDSFPGLPADRMPRLHGVARAALDGRLDAARLLDQGPERAMARPPGARRDRPVLQFAHRDPRHRVRRRAAGQRAPGPGPGRAALPAGRAPVRSRVPGPGPAVEAVPDLGRGTHPGRGGPGAGRGGPGQAGAPAGVR